MDGESDAMIVPRAVGYHVEEESGDFTAEKTTASKTTASKNSIVIWIAPLLLVVAGCSDTASLCSAVVVVTPGGDASIGKMLSLKVSDAGVEAFIPHKSGKSC